MNFGDALVAIKAGNRVARDGWNGKGMWIALVRDWRARLERPPIGAPGGFTRRMPWIVMRTADAGFVPWLASQTDVLAEDWQVIA